MNKKEIEKIAWISKKHGTDMVVEANVFNVKNEKVLIIDITMKDPIVRICISKKDYADFFPTESPMEKGPIWSHKNMDNLNIHGRLHRIGSKFKTKISEETLDIIRSFAGGSKQSWSRPWESEILQIQNEINYSKNSKAEKRRNERLVARMKTISKIPIGFEKWAASQVDKHQISILPFGKKKKTKGICSYCKTVSEFERGKIKPHDIAICPHCGKAAYVKRVDWENKNPLPVDEVSKEVILFQKTSEGYVERHFIAWKDIGVNEEKEGLTEKGRIFRICRWTYTYYAKADWYGHTYWDDRNVYGMNSIQLRPGPVYTKNITADMFADSEYKYSGIELLVNEPGFEPLKYLAKYETLPQLEMMIKVGLRKLAIQISSFDFVVGKKPWEMLDLTKEQFNRMRKINGGRSELIWMEYEKKRDRFIEDDVIQWFSKEIITPTKIKFIADRLTELKICNYLKKQCKLGKKTPEELLGTWEDYLSMAKRLKMDTSLEIIYKPKELEKSHNEAIKLCGGEEVAKRASEISEKFNDVDDICKEIVDKYEYSDEEYSIVVPRRIEDIIVEGRVLGHCLDASNIYFDRINRRESYIVFLRKAENPEQPYYTLEIEPGGSTRQKRTTGDKQNKDFNSAKEFIRKWQKEIQKKLTKIDKELAEKSAILRVEEFKELRMSNTKIWHGCLAGQLLVDVLEADLMEIENERMVS